MCRKHLPSRRAHPRRLTLNTPPLRKLLPCPWPPRTGHQLRVTRSSAGVLVANGTNVPNFHPPAQPDPRPIRWVFQQRREEPDLKPRVSLREGQLLSGRCDTPGWPHRLPVQLTTGPPHKNHRTDNSRFLFCPYSHQPLPPSHSQLLNRLLWTQDAQGQRPTLVRQPFSFSVDTRHNDVSYN